MRNIGALVRPTLTRGAEILVSLYKCFLCLVYVQLKCELAPARPACSGKQWLLEGLYKRGKQAQGGRGGCDCDSVKLLYENRAEKIRSM